MFSKKNAGTLYFLDVALINVVSSAHSKEALHPSKFSIHPEAEKAKTFGYLPIMPVNARDQAGTNRDKQGQAGTR